MNRFHRWYCGTGLWAREISRVASWALQDCRLGPDALEIGPGRGHTTGFLRRRVDHLTAVEIDPVLADGVRSRFASAANVEVVTADATNLPFEDQRFSGAVCFTMLHHVPSAELQDRLISEVHRVLRPGGVFAGSDSTSTVRSLHASKRPGSRMRRSKSATGCLPVSRPAAVMVTVARADPVSRARDAARGRGPYPGLIWLSCSGVSFAVSKRDL